MPAVNIVAILVLTVAIFVLSWGISTLIYRWKRYDDLPVDPSPTGASTTGACTPA